MNNENAKKNKYGHVIVKALVNEGGVQKGKLYSGLISRDGFVRFKDDTNYSSCLYEGNYELIHDYTYPVMIGEECEFLSSGEWKNGSLYSVRNTPSGIVFNVRSYCSKYAAIVTQIRPITPPRALEDYTKEELIARVRELEGGVKISN